MKKLIAAMNMTLDGFCDHTAMIADDEVHEHYSDLLRSADALIIRPDNLSADGVLEICPRESYGQQGDG